MSDVSIIILNHKMRAKIEACLLSLFADLKGASFSYSIVVVDNASDDGLLDFIKFTYPNVTTIQNDDNIGFAKGVNIGLKSTLAKYYFILNPDTVFFEPNTIGRLVEFMDKNPKIGMCGPKLMNSDGTLQYSCHRFPTIEVQLMRRTSLASMWPFKKRIDKFLMKEIDRTVERPVDWLMGSAMFVRGSALETIGFLDERYWMYFEDMDWCRRFWEAGWPIYYVPQINLMHHHGRGSASVPGIVKALCKNKLAREHLKSWANYFWKWSKLRKYLKEGF